MGISATHIFSLDVEPAAIIEYSSKKLSLYTKCFPVKNCKTNRELLLLLREGDHVAFYNIYERYCKRLYGFVLRYIKQESDAEEIVQEVFVKIWEARNRIDINSSFESFLFTIAYNTTMSIFRRRVTEQKYVEHLKSLQHPEITTDVTDEIRFSELNEKVQTLLDSLTPRQKEIFHLSRMDGLTHEEIAEKLDISVLTVKKHITNTLAFLKSHIDTSLMVNLLYFYFFL